MPLTKKDLQSIEALLEKSLAPLESDVKDLKSMLNTGKYVYPPIFVTKEGVIKRMTKEEAFEKLTSWAVSGESQTK